MSVLKLQGQSSSHDLIITRYAQNTKIKTALRWVLYLCVSIVQVLIMSLSLCHTSQQD